jgi:nitroreductase
VELSEVVTLRHMTRNFAARPLDDQVVDELLTLALRAPSAGHTQGREFVVLEGAEQTARYWRATTDEEWRSRSRRYAGLSRAPVVILVFSDPPAYVARYRERDKVRPDGKEVEWTVPFWFVDAAFSTMHLLLGAADREVGAAFRWLGAVLLGQPAEPDPRSSSSARPRRTLGDSVHRGSW